MITKKLAGSAVICAATIIGAASTASAGEVTGNGDQTPISDRAASACAFSGLEDGIALAGFDEDGPIFVEVPTGPGLVQNPHMENSAGVVHAPGIPGQACRGNTTTDL